MYVDIVISNIFYLNKHFFFFFNSVSIYVVIYPRFNTYDCMWAPNIVINVLFLYTCL